MKTFFTALHTHVAASGPATQNSTADSSEDIAPINTTDIKFDQDPKEQCQKVYSNFLKKIADLGVNTKEIANLRTNIWEKISLEANKNQTDHLDMDTPIALYEEFKGSTLTYSTPNKRFVKSQINRLSDINCIAMGGMDFYSMEYFGALRKYLNIFSARYINTPLTDTSTLYYYPQLTKKDRYAELIKFHDIENYVSSEMFDFAQLHVIPKISTGEKLAFFCFSASCREVLMLETACRFHLTNTIGPAAAREAMSNVTAFLFGYAFDKQKDEALSFRKIMLTSVEDFGVLRPDFNRNFIYGCSNFNYGINCVSFKGASDNCHAIIFGANTVPMSISGKINRNGHHLGAYVEGLNQLSNTANDTHVTVPYTLNKL